MAAGDTATAKRGVERLGTVEVETQRPTDTLGADKDKPGRLASARERKTLVIDTERTGLRIGQAYLRPSGHPPALIAIGRPENLPVIASNHIPFTPAIGQAATASTPAPASRIEYRHGWWTGAA